MRTLGVVNGCVCFFPGWFYQFHLPMSFKEHFTLRTFLEFLPYLEMNKYSHAAMLYFKNAISFFMNFLHEFGPFCC